MTAFLLLRLPFIAIEEVLCQMTPFALINLSLVSTKSKTTTKSVTKLERNKNRFQIISEIRENPKLSISKLFDSYVYEMTSGESEDEKYENAYLENVISKYSEDILKGYLEWAGYVLEILNCQIQIVIFNTDVFPDKNKAIIDFWESHSESIERCFVMRNEETEDVDDVTVGYLLENVKITSDLTLNVKLSDNLRAPIPRISDQILIEYGTWITLEQMLEFESDRIIIRRSNLTNQELNRFLKAWKLSELDFSSLKISIQDEDERMDILDGLETEEQGRAVVCKRGDGKEGWISLERWNGLLLLKMSVY